MRIRPTIAVALAVLVVTAGCFGGDDESRYGEPPSTSPRPSNTASPSAPVSASPSSEEERILAQYRKFWTEALPAAFAAPASERRRILEPVTMEPELGLLLGNMAANDSKGEKGYGVDVPLRQVVEVKGSLSLVKGCLDSSNAGILKADGGKKLTRGPERNSVLVNLKRGHGNAWRVSAVEYSGSDQC